MSKAFTREDDDQGQPLVNRPRVALPPGAKNYLTSDGAVQLRRELERLVQEERPRLSAAGSDPDAKGQLSMLDQKILQLEESLQSAVVVDPLFGDSDRVRFGAFVQVRTRTGEETEYRIVGVDEMDVDRNWISWASPLARALINGRTGDRVSIRLPGGQDELLILSIRYA